jgi:uncharacterized membrane protein (DUF106 family)
MNYPLLVSLCFLPLVIIFIVTKIFLWMSSSVSEVKYVKEEEKKPHGPFLTNVYEDSDRENESDDYW